jgi:hypothetical protein
MRVLTDGDGTPDESAHHAFIMVAIGVPAGPVTLALLYVLK